jgi:hypothetical protein
MAMILGVGLRCLFGRSPGMVPMGVSRVGMVCRLLVIPGLVMFGRLFVVPGRMCGVF